MDVPLVWAIQHLYLRVWWTPLNRWDGLILFLSHFLSDLLCINRSACVQGDLVACGVLSGNRHLEGRLCDCVRANYLASPPLVVAYAIAGTVSIDLETEPLGVNSEGKDVYLRDVWPSKEEVNHTEENIVIASMFKELRSRMEVRDYNSTRFSENMNVLVIWIDWFTESVESSVNNGWFVWLSAERKYVLEQIRVCRICPLPVGSQIHLHSMSVLLQQTGECQAVLFLLSFNVVLYLL